MVAQYKAVWEAGGGRTTRGEVGGNNGGRAIKWHVLPAERHEQK